MANEEKEKLFSLELKEHIDFFRSIKEEYKYYSEKLEYCNNLMQDYLHSLELDNLKYAERSKLATKMAKCRKERRVYKDRLQVLDPLMKYIDAHYKILIDGMGNIVGDTRKIESNMKTRVYRRRVLPEDPKPPMPTTEEKKKPTTIDNSNKVIDQFFKNNNTNRHNRGRRKK